MYQVYIIFSTTLQRFYTGITHDFAQRLSTHNSGLSVYTAKGIPWEVKWLSDAMGKTAALRLEKTIKKRGAGRYLSDIGR